MVDSELSIFNKHLSGKELKTPDPYDVWNMRIGQAVKQIYYKRKILGVIPAAMLTVFDFYFNNRTRIGYEPRSYPIAHAYKVLISLELYKNSENHRYIDSAKTSLDWLNSNSSKNYSGYCWGINMPWVSKIATYNETIPHVTHTPYVLEAFLNFQAATKTTEYDQLIDSILKFLEDDLNKIIDNRESLALSYSPLPETRIVVNANSYSMFCYALFYDRNKVLNMELMDKVKRIYSFLVKNQNDNGSWFYFADQDSGNFIDCFHSCFVLKNIYKVNKIIPLTDSSEIIAKGYSYIKQFFWDDKKKLFRRFSITDRASLVKYDLYDNAEMLNLAILLDDHELIETLSVSVEKNFVVGTDVYSNIVFPNLKVNKNTLRWATLPYLYALSKLIK